MSDTPTTSEWIRRSFRDTVHFGKNARVLLIVGVSAALLADSAFRALAPTAPSLWRGLFGTLLTITVAAFAWRPTIAALLIMLASIGAPYADAVDEYLIALAVLIGLVVATCSALVIGMYTALLVGWAGTTSILRADGLDLTKAVIILALAALSFALGFAARTQMRRSRELAERLLTQEQTMAAQLAMERRLIADELHDIVAHDITIAVMHARVLARTDDPATRTQSQEAIQEASMRALTDIRRILKVAGHGEAPSSTDELPETVDLDGALTRAVDHLKAVGLDVQVARPDSIELEQSLVLAVSRIISECTTNVLKHAARATRVSIDLRTDGDFLALTFTDNSPASVGSGLPSSGYGLERMRERVQLMGGSVSAAPLAPGWAVEAVLPLRPDGA